MSKNDDQIPAVRIPKEVRKLLERKAEANKRKLSDFVRMKLIEIANEREGKAVG